MLSTRGQAGLEAKIVLGLGLGLKELASAFRVFCLRHVLKLFILAS